MRVAKYLLEQAQRNPNAFMTLVAKVLPTVHAGDRTNPIIMELSDAEKQRQASAVIDAAFREHGVKIPEVWKH